MNSRVFHFLPRMMLFLFLCPCFLCFFPAAGASAATVYYGIGQAGESMGVFSSPSKEGRVLTTIKAGELYLVIAAQGDWCNVFVLDNTVGYVPRSKVAIKWKDGRGIAIIVDQSDYATIFSGPSGNNKALTKIREGQEFIIIGKGDWVRVLTREKVEGYIRAAQVVDIWP
jgi:hypothetical protein